MDDGEDIRQTEQGLIYQATMASDKECVAPDDLAKALLEYALKPAGPDLKRECTQHYLDEMRFLSLFSVDYVLGMKAVSLPAFASVRTCYNEEIERLCASKRSLFTYSTVIARFEAYSEACNANCIAPKEYNGKRLVFWELGETISGLASDADPWVPSALEVSLHANIFLRECKQLSDFLEQYEVTQ
jgi:hypothetical protein